MNIREILKLNDLKKENVSIGKNVVIYGAGNFGQKCANILKKEGHNILYFIDKEKYKTCAYIDDIEVISIEDKRLDQTFRANTECIIGIFNAYVDLYLIEKELQNHKFKSIINPLAFYDTFSEKIGDYFWLSAKKQYHAYEEQIVKSYDLLEDTFSKELFKNILLYRFTNSLDVIQAPQNVLIQYFPKDICCKYPTLKFLDCGAYDGDTILKIIQQKLPLSSYVAFEPDIQNIKALSNNLKLNAHSKGYIYPCGVWDKTTQLRFNGGTGSSCHISDSGDDIINVVAIDEVILNSEVNFIKMDIEGAEIQALNGAQEIIKKYEPILAISAYHKFDDLWSILETIQSFGVEYKYYMRMYEYNGFEIVYYAIPLKYTIKEK